MTAAGCPKCGFHAEAPVLAAWTFEIPREVRSLNAYAVNHGSARFAYKRDRSTWQMEFKVRRINRRVPIATAVRRVTITRVYSGRQREFDRDNLHGGAKVVVDALVREQLIIGDDWRGAMVFYDQVRGETSLTVVLVEEMA
jgi:hypothetical protein